MDKKDKQRGQASLTRRKQAIGGCGGRANGADGRCHSKPGGSDQGMSGSGREKMEETKRQRKRRKKPERVDGSSG